MTITKEQFDALKVGDRVLVEGVVDRTDRNNVDVALYCGGAIRCIQLEEIHSILPRPDRPATGGGGSAEGRPTQRHPVLAG